ncbi:hypothetical protein K523DRAFT_329271 [Schizophyllum commune Tattone D]|nr:hypothetical protein K523DRAFT_329271 [Schizophyllum commune Tattone D]
MPRTRIAQWYAIQLVIMVLRLTFLFVRYRQRSTLIFLQDPMPRKSVNVIRSWPNAVQTGQLNASNLVDASETCTERHSSRMSINAHASSPNVVETRRLNNFSDNLSRSGEPEAQRPNGNEIP